MDSDDHAAIGDHGGAGGVAGGIGGEIDGETHHFAGLGVTVHGDGGDELVVDFGGVDEHFGELGFYDAGTDGVASHVGRAQLFGEDFGHGNNGGLGHGVAALHGAGRDARDGGHVDDGSAALLHHHSGGALAHEEVAFYVHIEGLVESTHFHVHGGPEVRVGGGVVHENIASTELIFNAIEQGIDSGRVAGVAGDAHAFGSGVGGDGCGHFVQRFLLAGADDDGSAVLGEPPGDGFADTPAGSGDDGDFIFQAEIGEWHGGSPWLVNPPHKVWRKNDGRKQVGYGSSPFVSTLEQIERKERLFLHGYLEFLTHPYVIGIGETVDLHDSLARGLMF